MQKGILGRTELEVSIVGLGAAFLGIPDGPEGGSAYDGSGLLFPVDEDLGVEAIHVALGAGCTLIDTAPLYCHRESERMIGRALRERPDLAAKCIVTTKVGQQFEGIDHSFDTVIREVEESRQRLGIDHFSILYIHDPMSAPIPEVMGPKGSFAALRKLQKEGLVDYIGVAANHPETNADYIETGEFDAAVVPEGWSLLNRWAERRIFPAARKHNVGLVVATPLERGLLATGPVAGARYINRKYDDEVFDHVRKIQRVCAEYEVPLPAAALQWCVRHPLVATTIPGARNPAEARANAEAASVDIPEAFWEALQPLVRHWDVAVFF